MVVGFRATSKHTHALRRHWFTLGFLWGSCFRSLVICVMFCRSLFVPLSFSPWPLYYLSFDLRLLISPLVSSNFSFIQILPLDIISLVKPQSFNLGCGIFLWRRCSLPYYILTGFVNL